MGGRCSMGGIGVGSCERWMEVGSPCNLDRCSHLLEQVIYSSRFRELQSPTVRIQCLLSPCEIAHHLKLDSDYIRLQAQTVTLHVSNTWEVHVQQGDQNE